ncbi:MAG TPA: 50S ribosomal protein L29 [Methylomirabilota bacterium]|nr:50S ribosomal protein L29 [Methylomirabilota bacterium]
MTTKDKKELQTKTVEEVKKLLQEAKTALIALRFDHQQNKLKNTRDIFNTRKKIAVLQTIMQIKNTETKEVKKNG